MRPVPDAIRPDGTFLIDGVAGPSAMQLQRLPPGWRVKTISLEGRDITYDVTDFGTGRRQVEIVLTEEALQPTSLTGSVIDSRGRAVSDYTVVVFPENRSRWLGGANPNGASWRGHPFPFLRRVRADQHGGYRVEGLPPADYLAVAVEPLPSNAYGVGQRLLPPDPELLEGLWAQATPFHLAEGEQQVLHLRLARTPPELLPGR